MYKLNIVPIGAWTSSGLWSAGLHDCEVIPTHAGGEKPPFQKKKCPLFPVQYLNQNLQTESKQDPPDLYELKLKLVQLGTNRASRRHTPTHILGVHTT